jgi:hypothetical protein
MLDVCTHHNHYNLSTCNSKRYGVLEEAQPEELKELESRVAGHDSIKKLGKNVLKSIGQKKRAICEVEFYETQVHRVCGLLQFVPSYMGVVNVPGSGSYIALEDLTCSFKHPSIIDFKIGTTVAKEHHDEERTLRKMAKYPLQQQIGFRVSGARIYSDKNKSYEYYDGLRFNHVSTEQDVRNVMTNDLFFNGTKFRSDALVAVIPILKEILAVMKSNNLYRFVSSSLLIIYDTDSERIRVDAKMIDFVHVYDLNAGEHDKSYVKGLTNLIQFFEELI